MQIDSNSKIGVIGLGYVGFPLAINLAKHYKVIGYDINAKRLDELSSGIDSTCEIDSSEIISSSLRVTNNKTMLSQCDVYIITVPTPVNDYNSPDLSILESASRTVGDLVKPGNIIAFESTVYPGVTEDICGKIIDNISGLQNGKDYFLGYSPERINPGDKVHTVDKITKVVSAQTPDALSILMKIYNKLTNNNCFAAKDIKTAEAAKVIENTQRDINIAFINEVTTIVNKLGLSVYDVLEAASTKWNFLNFTPGMVGGHCIGVDPYYLAHLSRIMNHEPQMILSGRNTNENMSKFFAYQVNEKMKQVMGGNIPSRILILGLTFKENIPDLRNSKVIDFYNFLTELKHNIDVYDPYADKTLAAEIYGITLIDSLSGIGDYDCIVGAVNHNEFNTMSKHNFMELVRPGAMIYDIKQIWNKDLIPEECLYQSI